ncbi:MAG: penicillin-binding protein 2 [Candidatus Magasanikbacteria bacterium]
MYQTSHTSRSHNSARSRPLDRIRIVGVLFVSLFIIVIARLFILMIIQHDFYDALAAGSHEMTTNLFPERGSIYLTSSDKAEEYPLAINRDVFLMFADTREIIDENAAEMVAQKLAELFAYPDDKKFSIYLQLNKRSDPYEPLEKKVEQQMMEQVTALQLPGIHFVRRSERYYPEKKLAASVVGFVGKDEEGNDVGRYGIEGYWDKELAGNGGFLEGIKGATGNWIPLAGRLLKPAQDGVDLVLTIDRTLQYEACAVLQKDQEEYGAQTASLIIMEPKTGAIRVMCSFPDFDPNQYNQVESSSMYNNTAVFTAYEPGSIFKPIAMSAVLNEELVTPETYFHDSGSVDAGCTKLIQNADLKSYGDQTMTGVLENSINTGMVFVVNKLGKQKFKSYIEQYGFGTKTGIDLDTESSGTIGSLSERKDDKVDCYTATASFGQGITATPLQMATAFSAIANGGMLMKPFIVQEVRYPQGKVVETRPKEVRRILEKRNASLLSGMLVRVIDQGQGTLAKVPGYYIAGKTGTAQIAGPGGYTDETNHSFIGFGPVDDPAFVMIIRFEKPRRAYASLTAASTFSKIAKFMMNYYHIPPSR